MTVRGVSESRLRGSAGVPPRTVRNNPRGSKHWHRRSFHPTCSGETKLNRRLRVQRRRRSRQGIQDTPTGRRGGRWRRTTFVRSAAYRRSQRAAGRRVPPPIVEQPARGDVRLTSTTGHGRFAATWLLKPVAPRHLGALEGITGPRVVHTRDVGARGSFRVCVKVELT